MSTGSVAAKSLLVTVILICATTGSPGAIAEDTSAGPPTVHSGDVWVDRLSSGDQDFKVTSVTSNEIAYAEWGANLASDLQWNPIETRASIQGAEVTVHYEKPLLLFPFPLTPGKSWNAETSWQIPHTSQAGRVKVAGSVGDWEQVSVPAGAIRALRVDVTTLSIGRIGLNNRTVITYWYAPKFNRFVKIHIEDAAQGIIDEQLVSYRPAKPE
jgi:hypothetical protein